MPDEPPESTDTQPREYQLVKAPEPAAPPRADEREPTVSLLSWFTGLLANKSDTNLRETIHEYISDNGNLGAHDASITHHERVLLSNILRLQKETVTEVMIPRADIAALDINTPTDQLLAFMAEQQFSRFPVYRDTLDDILGTVHIKDVLTAIAKGQPFQLQDFITEIPVVSPTMTVLDLILKMRQTRRHMALIIDEYGGIDGLVTVNDVIELIVGEIYDEHDDEEAEQIIEEDGGSIIVDARLDISEFESLYGPVISEEEKNESDTIGGVVSYIAGRVPVRGEILTHASGMVFEVLDADPRRIHRVRIRNIPHQPA